MEARTEQQQQKRHRTSQLGRKQLHSPCASPGRVLHILGLPDDVMNIIFSKLNFTNKICTGLVCKQWDELLKAGSGALRHWAVDYNLDSCVSKDSDPSRWLVNRAAAIKHVRVTATLSSDEQGDATRRILDIQLPLLANSLSKNGTTLALNFHGGSPFGRPPLSRSAFRTLLCPMVKRLSLCDLTSAITARQFAAICGLSSLEYLSVSVADYDSEKDGLRKITKDISKLVHLKGLTLERNFAIEEVSVALASLASLTRLCIMNCGGIRIPPKLQGMKCLTTVAMTDCWLESIPEALTGLANLTSLDLSENQLESRQWWPTTLSRLSKLANLVLHKCGIVNLPPHISALGQLTGLQISGNKIRHLPWELSSLQKLRQLWANGNRFSTVPIHVLSSLAALTSINFPLQGHCEEGASYDLEDYFPSGSEEEYYDRSDDEEEEEDEEAEEEEDEEEAEEEDDDQYSGGSPLTGPSTPVSLDLSWNCFDSNRSMWAMWSVRWPTNLSRLTGLADLDLSRCNIASLPSDMSRLRQLTKLDLSNNNLTSLPEWMSRLRSLNNLVMDYNSFPTVPVSVLSSLTALTNISLCSQSFKGSSMTFKVSSSLQPILHAGLVKLNLSQSVQWDPLSLCHIQHAMGAVADRTPIPTVEFLPMGG